MPHANINALLAATQQGNFKEVDRLLSLPETQSNLAADHNYLLHSLASGVSTRVAGLVANRDQLWPEENKIYLLERILAAPSVREFITAGNNSIFFDSLHTLDPGAQYRLLEIPEIYANAEIMRSDGSRISQILLLFIEYFFNKLNKRIKKSHNFAVNQDEAQLCYMILRELIVTYADRDKIRLTVRSYENSDLRFSGHSGWLSETRLAVRQRRAERRANHNLHLARITTLLNIPAVQQLAAANHNELLRLALGLQEHLRIIHGSTSQYLEVTAKLRTINSVKEHEATHPIDVAHERTDPKSIERHLERRYWRTHPTTAMIEYEAGSDRLCRDDLLRIDMRYNRDNARRRIAMGGFIPFRGYDPDRITASDGVIGHVFMPRLIRDYLPYLKNLPEPLLLTTKIAKYEMPFSLHVLFSGTYKSFEVLTANMLRQFNDNPDAAELQDAMAIAARANEIRDQQLQKLAALELKIAQLLFHNILAVWMVKPSIDSSLGIDHYTPFPIKGAQRRELFEQSFLPAFRHAKAHKGLKRFNAVGREHVVQRAKEYYAQPTQQANPFNVVQEDFAEILKPVKPHPQITIPPTGFISWKRTAQAR